MAKSALYKPENSGNAPTKTACLAIDRPFGRCAYPLWDGPRRPYTHQFVCGAPNSIGSYCAEHAKLCYRLGVPKADIEREMAFAAKHVGAKVGSMRNFIANI